MPATRDGRIDLCSHNPLVADVFPSMSERATFVLIAYLTDAGRGIEPIENPITVPNAEFKDSADADGHLKAGTRLARMSNAAYAAEKRRATEAGELWLGALPTPARAGAHCALALWDRRARLHALAS